MFSINYNRNQRPIPALNDRVTICYTSSSLDTKTGTVVGWYNRNDNFRYIAIVLLDEELSSGEKAVTVPVVCLTQID